MEVVRGTLREVVAFLPDEADIKIAVPVRYQTGQLEAIYDVVFSLTQVEVPDLPSPKPTRTPSRKATATVTVAKPRPRNTVRKSVS